MASIEEDIVEWINSRPDWQRLVAAKLIAGGDVDQAFVDALARQMVEGQVPLAEEELLLKDLPNSSSEGLRVEFRAISELSDVNAITAGQSFTFGPTGLTAVYGDNGSGKSGYARLLKALVGARHQETILPNAFTSTDTNAQAASITYAVDGVECVGVWPTLADVALRQIHFYDEACGDDYLARDTELAYRPSALKLIDGLIATADRLRVAVDARLAANGTTVLSPPALVPGTEAQLFVAKLSATTTVDEINAITTLPANAEATLAAFVQEEARLVSTDPAKEKARLSSGADLLEQLAGLFDLIAARFSPENSTDLEESLASARALRTAADVASSADFANEPLVGVGTSTWRALWEAAEAFSIAEAYPERPFPASQEGDHCVLCHQPLGTDARDRLHRFHAFVCDETARNANIAEGKLRDEIAALKEVPTSTTMTTEALAFLVTEDRDLAASLKDALSTAELAKARIGERLRAETAEDPLPLATVNTDGLRILGAAVSGRADVIDDVAFRAQLKAVMDAKNELSDRISLSKHANPLKSEVKRLVERARISAARTSLSTATMTTKSSELSRKYVTAAVNDRFARETDRLGLEHVILGDRGGDKGRLRHKPALLGAKAAGATVEEVLSEGEQTALGLAGLFTEVRLDESKSAVVLDDPITSLDHRRREKVATQIASLAQDRQVIVFTHDLTFLGDLVKAATEAGIELTERTVARTGADQPGMVLNGHPWKAKDAAKRVGDLEADLARLQKQQPDVSAEEYERLVVDWAGRLSETWERIVRTEVVNKVVDRGTTEVRPKMIRMLALITEDDNTDFQNGYSQVSKWARRHDKSEEVNFTLPTHDEMQAELGRCAAWLKRIKGYANA